MFILPRFCFLVLSGASYILIGLIFSTLSVLLILSKKLFRNKKWVSTHKMVMHKLYCLAIKQLNFVTYFGANIKINTVLNDMKMLEHFEGQPFSLMVVNHPTVIDLLFCVNLHQRLGFPPAYKFLAAKMVKNLFPTFGLSNEFVGNIAVNRSWKKDKLELSKKLNNTLASEGQLALVYWPEGAFWTSIKRKKAIEYAESRGIRPFKYHLVPRTKGFNVILKKLVRSSECVGRKFHIYNTQIVFRDNPTLMDWLNGKEIHIDSFIEEIELTEEVRRDALDESLQPEDCKACTKFLFDVFRRKDELVEEYKRNGNKFLVKDSKGGVLEEAPLLDMFLVWLASVALTLWLMYYIFDGLAGLVTALAVVAASNVLWIVSIYALTKLI